jgi:uncharacterized membrane protein
VINPRLCRNEILRLLAALVIISLLTVSSAYSLETEDSQSFIAGFNAFQQKDYAGAINKMSEVLQKFPDTPLRDMALFWLARSYYRAGNHQSAARYLTQFSKEYPGNPLKGTVEEELLALAARYERGETLTSGPSNDVDRKATPSEQQRLAVVQSDTAKADKLAKIEQERSAAELAEIKADKERAALKEEAARQAAATEKARSEAVQREKERIAAEKAAKAKAEQLASMERERIAAEQAAKLKAEQERVAAMKAAAERKAVEAATEKARIDAAQREKERIAAEQAVQLKAEQERAAMRAEAERKAAEAAAVAAEKVRIAEEKTRAARSAYREKAIAQYRAIIGTYPDTPAAATAAAKLRELGLAVALPVGTSTEPLAENAQVLRLEVAQYSGFEVNLLPFPESFSVALPITVPFEILNRGNGRDAFTLESAFPAEFNARFTAATNPGVVISQTPLLAPGDTFKGAVQLSIPSSSIDGQRITYPIKVASSVIKEASQSREIRLTVSAPLLRAVLNVERSQVLPGEKMVYRIAVLNVGSTSAQDVTLRLNFPQQLEPLDFVSAGFRREKNSALVSAGLQLKPGENREFSIAFQLTEDSLAGQEIAVHAELINNPLQRTAAFVSNVASVQLRHGVMVRAVSKRLTVIPGQSVNVPFVVTNTGNVREKFKVTSRVTESLDAISFLDFNRDGIRQTSEPVINKIGPLLPKEEASVVMEIKTSRSAVDGSQENVAMTLTADGDSNSSATEATQLVYSRPVLKLDMVGRSGSLKPGDVATYDLNIVNTGSNLAQTVELKSVWPEQLELVASDPVSSAVAADGRIVWRFKEVGAGEKRSIKVSFRVKADTGAGTNVQVKNVLIYEDQMGNKY